MPLTNRGGLHTLEVGQKPHVVRLHGGIVRRSSSANTPLGFVGGAPPRIFACYCSRIIFGISAKLTRTAIGRFQFWRDLTSF